MARFQQIAAIGHTIQWIAAFYHGLQPWAVFGLPLGLHAVAHAARGWRTLCVCLVDRCTRSENQQNPGTVQERTERKENRPARPSLCIAPLSSGEAHTVKFCNTISSLGQGSSIPPDPERAGEQEVQKFSRSNRSAVYSLATIMRGILR